MCLFAGLFVWFTWHACMNACLSACFLEATLTFAFDLMQLSVFVMIRQYAVNNCLCSIHLTTICLKKNVKMSIMSSL